MTIGIRQTALSLALFGCVALAQAPAPALRAGGDVSRPLSLTLEELGRLPRISVNVTGQGRYEGVLLYEILQRAGAPLGKELDGPALASYVVAEGHDGYQVVLTLTEIDPGFAGNQILVADRLDGKPLPERLGPLRLVVPNEKRAARSVRMLERLTVVRLRK